MAKKLHRSKRTKRYYGLIEIREGKKYSWVSQQNRNGWSLGIALNTHTVWLRNLRFKTKKEVQRAMAKVKVVFIQLKDSE